MQRLSLTARAEQKAASDRNHAAEPKTRKKAITGRQVSASINMGKEI
jgi:hypothetical protein